MKKNYEKKLDKIDKKINTSFTTQSAYSTENLQWTRYKTPTGHGFSAEDANSLVDILKGKKVDNVGLSNVKNGADRIVNGELIQTKYYTSASKTVDSAFDSQTGYYKYSNQKLEVPSDQYDSAINRMAQKIKEGKVEGYSNPKDAEIIIKRGSVTYKQAHNITKAGNIDSIIFDIKSQCLISTYAFGISFGIQYANCKWNGMSHQEAFKISILSSLKSSGFVLASGVVTQQFLRTTIGRSFAAYTTSISRNTINSIYNTKIGQKVIHKTTSALLGKNISGIAAKNSATKILRTNAVTAIITTTIITIPDFYRTAISNKMSWKQFSKNLTVNIGGVSGGIGGAWAGAVIGAPGGPIGVGIGGFVGGVIGSFGVSIGLKNVIDLISDDDSKEMFELIKDSISKLSVDYMISEKEFEQLEVEKIIEKIVNQKWLYKMYQCGTKNNNNSKNLRLNFAYKRFKPYFRKVTEKREKIILPTEKQVKLEFTN